MVVILWSRSRLRKPLLPYYSRFARRACPRSRVYACAWPTGVRGVRSMFKNLNQELPYPEALVFHRTSWTQTIWFTWTLSSYIQVERTACDLESKLGGRTCFWSSHFAVCESVIPDVVHISMLSGHSVADRLPRNTVQGDTRKLVLEEHSAQFTNGHSLPECPIMELCLLQFLPYASHSLTVPQLASSLG